MTHLDTKTVLKAGIKLTKDVEVEDMTDEQLVIKGLTYELARAKYPFSWRRKLHNIRMGFLLEEFSVTLEEANRDLAVVTAETELLVEALSDVFDETEKTIAALDKLTESKND